MLSKIPARWLLLTFFSLTILIAGCSGGGLQVEAGSQGLASTNGLPADLKNAPTNVRQAYEFAVANPDLVQQFPCYCGCGKMGHTSNYSCYVAGEGSDGAIQYDTHALGCSICVDITQDVMRLSKDGKPIAEIQSYVDNTYSQYGPSNMPGASLEQ